MQRVIGIQKPNARSKSARDGDYRRPASKASTPADTFESLDLAAPSLSGPVWDFSRIPIHPPKTRETAQTSTPPSLTSAAPPKLEVGALGDPLEGEADRIASELTGISGSPLPDTSGFFQPRSNDAGKSGKEDRDAPQFQSAAVPRRAGTAPAVVHEALRAPGRPLDGSILPLMNRRFNYDFNTVRIHDGPLSDHAAQTLHAAAFTVGKDIVFAAGRLAPSTAAGRRLIAHELAHVVQQGRGGFTVVQRSAEGKDDPAKKKEDLAEKLARRIAQATVRLDALEALKAEKKRNQQSITIDESKLAYDAVVLVAGAALDPASFDKAREFKARYDSIVQGTAAEKPASYVPLPAASKEPMTAQEAANVVRAQRGFDYRLTEQEIAAIQQEIGDKEQQIASLDKQIKTASGADHTKLNADRQRLGREINVAQERIAVFRPTLKRKVTLLLERDDLQAQIATGGMTPGRKTRVENRIAKLDEAIAAIESGQNRLPLLAYQGGRLGAADFTSEDPYERLQWHQKTYVNVQVIYADGTAGPVFQARNNPAADLHAEDVLIAQMKDVSDPSVFQGATLVISGDQEVCERCAPRVQKFANDYGVAKVVGSTEHGPKLTGQGKNSGAPSRAKTLTGKVSDPSAVQKMEKAQQETRNERAGKNLPQEYKLKRSYARKLLFLRGADPATGAPPLVSAPPAKDNNAAARERSATRGAQPEGSIEPPDKTRPDIQVPNVASGATIASAGNVRQPAQSKINAHVIRATTSVDARARARAAEFSPLFFEWQKFEPVERQARIEQLINAHLASEGVPPVRVNLAGLKAGDAEFQFKKWKIYISQATLDKPTLTLDEFAELADNATHEARHAVHHFRGLRIALREGRHTADANPQNVVAAARQANKRADPRSQLSAEAYGEAKEIYEVTHLETPRREAMQAAAKARGQQLDTTRDVVNRSEIIQRRRLTADIERSAAQKVLTLDAAGKKGTRAYQDALSDHAIALREAINAHNEYTALPQETDAWRYGSAVRKAIKDRVQIQLRVNGAEIFRAQAAARARDAVVAGDEAAARKAGLDYLAADNRARAAQAELDALVPIQPRQLNGRTLTQEVAADPATGVPPRRTSIQVSPDDVGKGEQDGDMSAQPGGSLTSQTPPAKRGASGGKTLPGVPPKAPRLASPPAPIQSEHPPVAGSAPITAPGTPMEPKAAAGQAGRQTGKGVAQGKTEPTVERHGSVVSGQGDLIGAEKRKVVSGQRGGTPVTTTTAHKVAVRLDGTIAATTEATRETVIGTDSYGRPITQTRSAQAGLAISEKSATAHGSLSQQTAGGGRHSVGASGTIDASGNVSAQLSYSYLTKSGMSFTPSASTSYEVQASDVIKLDDGKFAVTFSATSTKGAGIAASKQFGGGPSVGVDIGTTEGTMDTGTRIFDDENKAKEFKKNAAMHIEKERLGQHKPLSSVVGALSIPVGEARGSGQLSGQSIGGSVAFEGASFGVGHHVTDIQQFEVTHVSKDVGKDIFQAKATMTGSKGTDVSLSGGIGLNRGGSSTRSFAVTWEFNLSTPGGQAAFEQYAKTLIPPFGGAKLVATEALDSEEDHDQVSIPLLGTAKWTGSTWEITRVDERGKHQQFGGEQSHDQDPSWIGRHVLGQDEIHSKAQIVSKLENGKEAGFEAQMTVKGDSGQATRDAFGEIFMGVPHQGTATASGEWNLSATIDSKVVHEFERRKDFRDATTNEEKLRIYSAFVKENGARMLGGQVRRGGDQLAWNLELKGDKNFPGTAGRDELERKRADLKQRLQTHPENAGTVVTDAQATLKELHARRDAVADKTKYTDLPDELREEQVNLIDKHIADFEFISHKASQEAIEAAPGEKIETTRTRLTKKVGYADTQGSADALELVKLRDKIADKERQIKEIDPKILEAIEAVQKAQLHMRQTTPGQIPLAYQHRADYNLHWNMGSNINDRQMAMAPKADELRLKLLDEHATPADQKTSAATLHALISERMTLLQLLLNEVNSSSQALKPITTRKGMAGHEKYWAGIKADDLPGSSEDDD